MSGLWNVNAPSGLLEELALAEASAVEYQQLGVDLWRERYYVKAREWWRRAAEEREHALSLAAELERQQQEER
jgi:hypothetical protein